MNSTDIARSYQLDYVFRGVWHDVFDLEETRQYLLNYTGSKTDTDYKRILCAYDYKMHG